MTAMLTTAGLTLSMTSANETAGAAAVFGAAGCAVRPPLTFNTEKARTPAPTAPASQPKRAVFILNCSLIAALLKKRYLMAPKIVRRGLHRSQRVPTVL